MPKAQPTPQGYDELDHALISELAEHPDLSHKALAERLGVAESTCTYRLKRLREAKLIGPKRFQVDYARLGYPLRAVVMVFLARHSREVIEEFMSHTSKLPHVLSIMNLTGRADIILTVAVADGEQLGEFILDHITHLSYVRGTESHIVLGSREGEWIPSP